MSLNTQSDPRAKYILEFPQGVNHFEAVRENPNYFYVDKTGIIAKLDNMPPHVVIHRPAYWGKTMFLTMLRCYYDVHEAENFDLLFGGLEIGDMLSLTKNTYHVLMLDFALDSSSPIYETASERRKNFKRLVFSFILKFAKDYNFPAPQELDPLFGIKTVANWVHEVGGKLLILIDDYDKVTNNLFSYGFDEETVHGLRCHIGGLLEAVKEVSSRYNCRSVLVGTSPLALSNVHGASIWLDVSQRPEFESVFGFGESDIRMAFRKKGLTDDEADRPLQVIQGLYAGYRFPRSLNTLCNPSSAVYFLDKYFKNASFQNLVHIISNYSSLNPEELGCLEDIHYEQRREQLLCIANLRSVSYIYSELLNPDNPVVLNHILRTLTLRDLADQTATYDSQKQRVVSFMYYFGLATTASPHLPYRFQVPNQLVHKMLLYCLKPALHIAPHEIISRLKQPTAADFLCEVLDVHLSSKFEIMDNSFSGRALQVELVTALKGYYMNEKFTGFANKSNGEGRFQICFSVDNSETIVIELKRIRPSTLDYSSLAPGDRLWHPVNTKHENWVFGELCAANNLVLQADEGQLRELKILSSCPLEYFNISTVGNLETFASTQCFGYLKRLRELSPGCAALGFTVIQIGWRFLVKPVRFPAI